MIFLFSKHNGIFDGALAAGAIGGKPFCEFSNPVASALKPFASLGGVSGDCGALRELGKLSAKRCPARRRL